VEGVLVLGAAHSPAMCAQWHKRLSAAVKARCSRPGSIRKGYHTRIDCLSFQIPTKTASSRGREMGPLDSQVLLQATLLQVTLRRCRYGLTQGKRPNLGLVTGPGFRFLPSTRLYCRNKSREGAHHQGQYWTPTLGYKGEMKTTKSSTLGYN
jgi:hypothetical protein